MTTKNDILCLIPARGNSKRLPHKNILDFHGTPVIAHTIKSALSCRLFDRVHVSTEDAQTASIAREYGAQVIDRPSELSQDTTRLVDVCFGALDHFAAQGVHFDELCLLLPTVVLRTSDDILATHAAFKDNNANFAVTVTEVPNEFNPHWSFTAKGKFLDPFLEGGLSKKRQEIEKFYIANQGVNFAKVAAFRSEKTLVGSRCSYYALPRERAVDIDTSFDFELAQFLYERQQALAASKGSRR